MRKVSHLKLRAKRLWGSPRQAPGVGHGIQERLNAGRGLPAKYKEYKALDPTEHGKRQGGK